MVECGFIYSCLFMSMKTKELKLLLSWPVHQNVLKFKYPASFLVPLSTIFARSLLLNVCSFCPCCHGDMNWGPRKKGRAGYDVHEKWSSRKPIRSTGMSWPISLNLVLRGMLRFFLGPKYFICALCLLLLRELWRPIFMTSRDIKARFYGKRECVWRHISRCCCCKERANIIFGAIFYETCVTVTY